jgi:hypothetical protein
MRVQENDKAVYVEVGTTPIELLTISKVQQGRKPGTTLSGDFLANGSVWICYGSGHSA